MGLALTSRRDHRPCRERTLFVKIRSASASFAGIALMAVLLGQGIVAPFGVSSLAVAIMIVALPLLGLMALAAARGAIAARYLRYNVVLAALLGAFAFVGYLRGGLAYPSYLVSIAIHQAFFACCLLLTGPTGVWRSFRFAALTNVFFVIVQMIGGAIGNDALVKLAFLGVMKGSIEYWHFLPRASGLMTEPAHLSYLLLPPLLVALLAAPAAPTLVRRGRALLVATYLLTLSLVAYVQLGLALLVSSLRGRSVRTLLLAVIGMGVMSAAYLSVPFIHDRVQGALAVVEGEVTDQSSVFAIQSNALVTASSLDEAPLLGRGITSHRQTYERVIDFLFDVPIDDGWQGLNKDDAGSLVLLLLSEGGVVGLAMFVGFVGYAVVRLARARGAGLLMTIGLAHALTLTVVGLRYGQWASVHVMLNLQVVLYCLATLPQAAAGNASHKTGES